MVAASAAVGLKALLATKPPGAADERYLPITALLLHTALSTQGSLCSCSAVPCCRKCTQQE